jgi:hypothetical protein
VKNYSRNYRMFYNMKFNLFLASLNNFLLVYYVFLVEFRTTFYFQSPPWPPLRIFFETTRVVNGFTL